MEPSNPGPCTRPLALPSVPNLGRVSLCLSPASRGSPRSREQGPGGLGTWMGPTAGWPSSTMRSPSSSSWFTHCSWFSSSCSLKCWGWGSGGGGRRVGKQAVRMRMPARVPAPAHPPRPADLVLPPHAHGVRHEVAPVLLQDALLLLGQGAQLARAALQVRVQAAQALPAPRGRFLRSGREGGERGTIRPHPDTQALPRAQAAADPAPRPPTQPLLPLTSRSRYWLRMAFASCLRRRGENAGPVRSGVRDYHPTPGANWAPFLSPSPQRAWLRL